MTCPTSVTVKVTIAVSNRIKAHLKHVKTRWGFSMHEGSRFPPRDGDGLAMSCCAVSRIGVAAGVRGRH